MIPVVSEPHVLLSRVEIQTFVLLTVPLACGFMKLRESLSISSANLVESDLPLSAPARDAERLLEAAIVANLEKSPEARIEAHESSLQLVNDLRAAGKASREAKPQSAT
jgi:hypothetical protein